MKRILGTCLVAAALFAVPACKEVEENDGKTVIIQDSLINVLPTWQALKIKIDEDKSRIRVIVGDATFYTAPADEKAKKADELGKMIMRIYGPNNMLTKGVLIVTKNVHNTDEEPKDGIETKIDIEGLKKGAGK